MHLIFLIVIALIIFQCVWPIIQKFLMWVWRDRAYTMDGQEVDGGLKTFFAWCMLLLPIAYFIF
jgi:hypothetical protein